MLPAGAEWMGEIIVRLAKQSPARGWAYLVVVPQYARHVWCS